MRPSGTRLGTCRAAVSSYRGQWRTVKSKRGSPVTDTFWPERPDSDSLPTPMRLPFSAAGHKRVAIALTGALNRPTQLARLRVPVPRPGRGRTSSPSSTLASSTGSSPIRGNGQGNAPSGVIRAESRMRDGWRESAVQVRTARKPESASAGAILSRVRSPSSRR